MVKYTFRSREKNLQRSGLERASFGSEELVDVSTWLNVGACLIIVLLAVTMMISQPMSLDPEDLTTWLTVALGIYGGFGAFYLLDPSNHMDGIKLYPGLAVAFVIVAALACLPPPRKISRTVVLFLLGLLCLIEAVGIKMADITQPGFQHSLYHTNLGLMVLGCTLISGFAFLSLRNHVAQKRASVRTQHIETPSQAAPGKSGEPTVHVITDAQPPANNNTTKHL